MTYRQANTTDINALKGLAIRSWSQFQPSMTPENWQRLSANLSAEKTYTELLDTSYSVVCLNKNEAIVGMSFLVPSGNPTEVFDASWSYLRFVTVDPTHRGLGIGKQLTERCIEHARNNGERTLALHTSEMMDAARHIYEGLGFKVLRELPLRLGKKY